MRDIEFTEQLDVAILSQRRVIAPYGMAGGEPGHVGVNQWHKLSEDKDGKEQYTVINLGGSNQCVMSPGDRIVIRTPGGGGYGPPGEKEAKVRTQSAPHARASGSLAARKAAQYSN